jgi:hypothetical protein
MSILEKDQIVELARKSREIDERPSVVSKIPVSHLLWSATRKVADFMQPLEPYYLRTFEKHAAAFPNDLNFIVELAQAGKPATGGNGFGVATCKSPFLTDSERGREAQRLTFRSRGLLLGRTFSS